MSDFPSEEKTVNQPQNGQTIPQGAQTAPANTQNAPQGPQSIPQNGQTVPANAQNIPQNGQPVRQGTQNGPQYGQPVRQGAPNGPQYRQPVRQGPPNGQQYGQPVRQGPPNGQQTVPENRQSDRQDAQTVPENRQTVPENGQNIRPDAQTVPENGQTVPEAEAVPGAESVPEAKEAQPTEKMEKRVKRYEHSVRDYQFLLLRFVLLLIVVWVMFFKVVGIIRMPSTDMYPRIDAGDMLLFYRLDTDVRAQDVIALQKVTPEGDSEVFVCRVVAVGGDTVDIGENGRLNINGSSMIESNIFYNTYPYENYTEFPLTLDEGQCFVLSDSRDGGSDSRYFGPVEREEILGTVISVLRRNNL